MLNLLIMYLGYTVSKPTLANLTCASICVPRDYRRQTINTIVIVRYMQSNTQSKCDWLFNIQSRALQADWMILVNSEQATLNIIVPFSSRLKSKPS